MVSVYMCAFGKRSTAYVSPCEYLDLYDYWDWDSCRQLRYNQSEPFIHKIGI